MSVFLQKLKSSGVVVDNSAGPDASGVITRKIEKQYATDPASTLGLELSEDAEVLSVEPNTPAAAANVPVGYMIYEVNNEFVETNDQFDASVGNHLNLVVKLQSLSSMYELIARILREEEHASVEEARKKIGLDELPRTTPRYGFLASDHPIFRRYTARLRRRREAAALMRQREREAEERMQKENRERIQKEMEAMQAAAKKAEEEARRKEEERRRAAQAAAPPQELIDAQNRQESFVRVFEDKSTFGREAAEVLQEKQPAPALEAVIKEERVEEPAAAQVEPEAPVHPPVSTSELLALLGAPTDIIPPPVAPTASPVKRQVDDLLAVLMGEPATVKYVILPAEEYTLKSGEKVIYSLKSRTGRLPAPPPGKPPKISREARDILNAPSELKKRARSESTDDSSSSSSSSSEDRSKRDRRRRKEDRQSRSDRHRRHHSRRDDSRGRRGRDESRGDYKRERDRHHRSHSSRTQQYSRR